MTPPNVIQFNASNVPVAQLTVSSDELPEQKIFDYGLNFIRVRLFTIPGLSTPAPFGGKQRQINVDIDPAALAAKGLSPQDVVNALPASNVIIPAGTARIGDREYNVRHELVADGGRAVQRHPGQGRRRSAGAHRRRRPRLRLVRRPDQHRARRRQARDLSGDPQARRRLDAGGGRRDARQRCRSSSRRRPTGSSSRSTSTSRCSCAAPSRACSAKAIISSMLVSLMIGLFLGSWRSMVIVCTSIPLAIFTAIIGLHLTGQTINIMTLGGLSLAIGMLVDDATVEVENIHRNRGMGKPLTRAILDGASQIAVPAIVATLADLHRLLPGRAALRAGEVPVRAAGAVGRARDARVLPAVAHAGADAGAHADGVRASRRAGRRRQLVDALRLALQRRRATAASIASRAATARSSTLLLHHRTFAVIVSVAASRSLRSALAFVVGTDFFPSVDAGLMKLHFRAPGRHAHRGDREAGARRRGAHPRRSSRPRSSRPSTT